MQTTPPDVTIVVVVRDAADDLRATLRSVEEQEGAALRRIETIVVDGASTDGTADVARRSPVPDLVLSEPDGGIYDAMNKGASRASGTWLHFLNAGDVLADPQSLGRILRGLERAGAEGSSWFVAGAAYSGGKVDGQVIGNVPHRFWPHAYGLQPHCHQATWFRRDRFLALGGHSLAHSFVGDFDLILRFGRESSAAEARGVVVRYQAGGLSAQRAREVPGLLKAVRRERLALSGAGRLIDDAVDAVVRGTNRARRMRWWLRAAALYVPKRVVRRSGPRIVGPGASGAGRDGLR